MAKLSEDRDAVVQALRASLENRKNMQGQLDMSGHWNSDVHRPYVLNEDAHADRVLKRQQLKQHYRADVEREGLEAMRLFGRLVKTFTEQGSSIGKAEIQAGEIYTQLCKELHIQRPRGPSLKSGDEIGM